MDSGWHYDPFGIHVNNNILLTTGNRDTDELWLTLHLSENCNTNSPTDTRKNIWDSNVKKVSDAWVESATDVRILFYTTVKN